MNTTINLMSEVVSDPEPLQYRSHTIAVCPCHSFLLLPSVVKPFFSIKKGKLAILPKSIFFQSRHKVCQPVFNGFHPTMRLLFNAAFG